MTKKILSRLSFLLVLIISVSCSKNEEIKKLSSTEITNFLLVNEQLPIKTLSNALEWPEDVILGVDLGLIELNADGKERLKDIFEDYSEDGKDDFIKDNNDKEWSEFAKGDWIKSETTKISKSKLNEIRDQEFKNNEVISNKIEHLKLSFVKVKTDEILDKELSLLSFNYYANMFKVFSLHVQCIPQKIKNLSISYLDEEGRNSFNKEWNNTLNSYINHKETDKINKNYIKFIEFQKIKYKFISGKKTNLYVSPLEIKLISKNTKDDAIVNYFSSNLLDYLIDFLLLPIVILFIPVIAIIYSIFFNISNFINIVAAAINFAKIASLITTVLFVFLFMYVSYQITNDIKSKINSSYKVATNNQNILEDLNLNTELFFTSI